MSPPDVRLASEHDAAAIAELVATSSTPFEVHAELARRYARLWVARATPHEPIAGDVLVAAHARRRGFGKALLSAVLARAREASFRVVLLEVRRDNAPAQNLYAGLGFEVVGEREKYYSDGEDAILMRREL